jgi:phosphoribosyl-ATP pyrophosphohydrolase
MAKRKKAKKKAHGKKRQNGPADVDEHVLDRLYLVIEGRKGADPDTS